MEIKVEHIVSVDRAANVLESLNEHTDAKNLRELWEALKQYHENLPVLTGDTHRQHVFFFMADEDGELITDIWTCSVPDIGEKVIIWNKEGFKHYTLKNRIYGANADEKVGCWNLYVDPTD